MQLATIEYARNVVGIEDPHSQEINPDAKNHIFHLVSGMNEDDDKGGTLRLGGYDCKLQKGSKSYEAYQSELISERQKRVQNNIQFRLERCLDTLLLKAFKS